MTTPALTPRPTLRQRLVKTLGQAARRVLSPSRNLRGQSAWLLLTLAAAPVGATVTLLDVEFASLPGNQVEIDLVFSGGVPRPEDFATENPSRIAIDFPGVTSALERRSLPIGLGVAHSLIAIEASDRTRVVINLNDSVPYRISTQGNRVTVALNPDRPAPIPVTETRLPTSPGATSTAPARSSPRGTLRDIDFRRGADGQGRVVITLPSAETRISVREEGRDVIVDIPNTELPQRLFRRLDVVDFATPVAAVESRAVGGDVRVDIKTGSEFEFLAYQTDNIFTVEFRELTPAEREQMERERIVYSGDRLSLNFQDIEVRAVLQLLADFTGLNLVASDTVRGGITLRLQNIPWDQALDIILKTKGLSMRQTGNVIMVAPTQEIAAQERLELESRQQIEELAPLRSEFVQINYARAADLAVLIKSDQNNLMSERGNVTVDHRTNTLLIQDTAAKLEDIRRLVTRLDIPVRQVMIESRVVLASNNFARDLGVRFGLSGSMGAIGSNELLVAGGQPGHLSTADINKGPFMGAYDPRFYQTPSPNEGPFRGSGEPSIPFNSGIEIPAGSGTDSLWVNLPAPTPSGAVNFLLGKVGSHLLQLELSAMQREGRGEVVSAPRVVTSDQHQAIIRVGEEIPVPGTADNAGTTTEFKDAVLQLDVTPHITPDDRIIMDLRVNKDSPNRAVPTVNNVPPITTQSVQTRVLVDNGETVVLGGVYEREQTFAREQVPWLGDLPVLGNLFKTTQRQDNNSELLIFVTPKILKGELATR